MFGIKSEIKHERQRPIIKSFNEFVTYMQDKYECQLMNNETLIGMKYDIEDFVNGLVYLGYIHSDLRVDLINFFLNQMSVGAESLKVLLDE